MVLKGLIFSNFHLRGCGAFKCPFYKDSFWTVAFWDGMVVLKGVMLDIFLLLEGVVIL